MSTTQQEVEAEISKIQETMEADGFTPATVHYDVVEAITLLLARLISASVNAVTKK